MAGLWGRQLQIDKNNVAAGVFFELLLRFLRCFRNLCKYSGQIPAGPGAESSFWWFASGFGRAYVGISYRKVTASNPVP